MNFFLDFQVLTSIKEIKTPFFIYLYYIKQITIIKYKYESKEITPTG